MWKFSTVKLGQWSYVVHYDPVLINRLIYYSDLCSFCDADCSTHRIWFDVEWERMRRQHWTICIPLSAKRSIFSHTIRKVSQSSFGWNLELFVPPGNRNLGFGQYRERKRKPFYIRSRNPVEASRDQSNQMSIKFAELSSQKTKVQLP